MESARETRCFWIGKTVLVDMEWLVSIPRLYFPAMSKLELYRTAVGLTGEDPENISEDSVHNDSCIYWKMHRNGTLKVEGFGGQSRELKTTFDRPNIFDFRPAEGEGYSITAYVTSTDNSTFVFASFCTNEGEMAWGVFSTVPRLPERTMNQIHEHAKSLGFKKEYFVNVNYDKCDLGGTSGTTPATVPTPTLSRNRMGSVRNRGGWNGKNQY
ncbi:unnamed protein product [Orchesella dallaii]|uniref:Lipocalin/cytosolic fatty-acid binding domain-containing protein n=1 Tax=Orchesella dallaii TaxID=48710 RepID=A0ABP1PM29_9HEXA